MRYRLHQLWLAITVLATPAAMTAQQPDSPGALLQGVVYDVRTGDAIAGATVAFSSLQQPTSSDSAGAFLVRGLRPGGHIVTVTRIGYQRRDLPINLTVDGNTFIEVALTPSPILLDSLTVVAPERVAVRGIVYDMVSGTAIPGAAVFVESEIQGTLADSLGSFVAADVPPGPQLITVKQIGYHDKVIAFTATGRPEDLVRVPLAPKPFMMDGITAVARNVETMEDRMRSRRGAASSGRGLIRAYDREALLASGAATGLDFVDNHTIVRMLPCPAGELEFFCIGRGSFVRAPWVYIDEVRQPEGLAALQRLSTSELPSPPRGPGTPRLSTIKTMLRKLEEYGCVEHRTNGRQFIYRPATEGLTDIFASDEAPESRNRTISLVGSGRIPLAR